MFCEFSTKIRVDRFYREGVLLYRGCLVNSIHICTDIQIHSTILHIFLSRARSLGILSLHLRADVYWPGFKSEKGKVSERVGIAGIERNVEKVVSADYGM